MYRVYDWKNGMKENLPYYRQMFEVNIAGQKSMLQTKWFQCCPYSHSHSSWRSHQLSERKFHKDGTATGG
jgi:hypothetical protein